VVLLAAVARHSLKPDSVAVAITSEAKFATHRRAG
jgi:hypothetical protein